MNPSLTRRDFFVRCAATASLAALTPIALAAAEAAPAARKFRKGIMWDTVGAKGSVLERMQAVKAAGFDGVEMSSHLDEAEVLKAREATGLEIPSVCNSRHWKLPLSHPDAKVREEALAALQQTLRDAKAYGAGSILLVPGVVNTTVTFEDCWRRSIEQIRLAIPLAEQLGVKISIENVWNNFITTEDQAVRYIDEIKSPWVGWHFDAGNIIRYGDPVAWILALGRRINRVHVKEYSRDLAMRTGEPGKGFGAPLLTGANNWPAIMKALRETGYEGYLITEQGGKLEDLAGALDRIIAS
jgi:L-ribulose-5-phosphate 3-epimerase